MLPRIVAFIAAHALFVASALLIASQTDAVSFLIASAQP